jgi:hypothetical protein
MAEDKVVQDSQTLAGDIFGDMVMEQAIADKTSIYEQQIKSSHEGFEMNHDE